LEESRRIDGIDLNSLEEVEITSYRGSEEDLLEFVEQLCRCNAPILKKLFFSHTMFSAPSSQTKSLFEKIRSMCHPKIEVEFYDFMDRAWVRFDGFD